MLILFCIILVFTSGRCREDRDILQKHVSVGADVTLTCNYHNNMSNPGSLYWIRHVPGNLPEVLGATYTFGGLNINNTPRFIATIGSGTYVLRISNTQLSDTAFYYCEIVLELQKTYGNFTFLRVTEPEATITAVTQEPPYDLVRPGDSVTFQCLVLSDSEKGACSEDHHVYWLRVSSAESHPAIIHVNANAGDRSEESPEAQPLQKCLYSFFKNNISSSDAGTYYCAVVTCGEIIFGNGTKLEIEATNMSSFLLSAALALSLIIIAFLIYIIKKNNFNCFSDSAAAVQTNAASANLSHVADEDTLIYSVAKFTEKPGRHLRRGANVVDEKSLYTDVAFKRERNTKINGGDLN
ncbi:uncharacterized protein LOC115050383 [Echeneis naucrates]|uniref:uncharacterized protein LOC115050383 n=1 Tax=Echeneis naucrates TaxID=173247 RepID=UPI0011135A64|nr:uncharacterized protein LOC115050383 [Echeneis naucrates]